MVDRVNLFSNEGQAATEYVLLLSVVVSFFYIVSGFLGQFNLESKLTKLIMGDFAASYQYGHPKAKGPDDGGPTLHPRVESGGNFRIFFGSDS